MTSEFMLGLRSRAVPVDFASDIPGEIIRPHASSRSPKRRRMEETRVSRWSLMQIKEGSKIHSTAGNTPRQCALASTSI
ncbi:hypothetical protein QQF64_026173 [Cirrhinus molitorella]|uniref:Uncharacterized protein n=1 Tax=Cirrhinus molitorella TaxID=172907 RepID=A0ABR3NRJ6_9TELE